MAKLSIEVTSRNRSSLFVLSALWEQGPMVAELVAEKARASLGEGDEPPQFLPQITALGRVLKTEMDAMVQIDEKLYDEHGQRAHLYQEREDDVTRLRQRVGGLRRIISGCYAAPKLDELGLRGRTPREPVALVRQSQLICKRLQREDLGDLLGDSLFDPPIDPKPFALQVEPIIAVLRKSYEAHHRSGRRVDQLLAEKKEVMKAYDTVFLRVARQFEDLCRLAGLDDLADKVRPSTSRPGETEVPPEGGEAQASEDSATRDAVDESEASPEGGEPALASTTA